MEKVYQFRELFSGNAKKDNKPFRILKLHDPETLEPAEFFLNDTVAISTVGIVRKDFVLVHHELQQMNGRQSLVVTTMNKQKVN